MDRCIQIKLGGEVFTFDGIDLGNEFGDNAPNIRNVIRKISEIPRHADNLTNLLNLLQNTEAGTVDQGIGNITEYADNVLGDVTPLELSVTLREIGQSPVELDNLVTLIGKNNEGIIKINEQLTRPRILLGQKRSLVLSPTKSFTPETLTGVLSYIYLDSKVKDTSTSVSRVMNDLYQDFKERTNIMKLPNSTAVLTELEQLDTVNRNKRLLAYMFESELSNENRDLFTSYSMLLNTIVNTAMETAKTFNSFNRNIGTYDLFEFNKPTTPIAFSENVNMTLGELSQLIYDYKTINTRRTAAKIIEDSNIDWNAVLAESYGFDSVSDLAIYRERFDSLSDKEKYISYMLYEFKQINPDGVYNPESFRGYNPAQLEFIVNNKETLRDIFDTQNSIETNEIDLPGYLLNKVVEHRPLGKPVEIPLGQVTVDFDSNMIVNPSRRISYDSKGNDPTNWAGVLNIEINKKIKNPYNITKNKLVINPNKWDGNIDTSEIGNQFKSIYVKYSSNENYGLLSEVLGILSDAGIAKELKTDGYETLAVRLVQDANNKGMRVSIYPKNGEFVYADNTPANAQKFQERFDFIMSSLPSSLKPTYKFYKSNSGHGYEFTNRRGNNNLNTVLQLREASMPASEFLNYFDLVKSGEITTLVTTSTKNNILANSRKGSSIDLYDEGTDNHARFKVVNKYKLDGGLFNNPDGLYARGTVWSDGTSDIMVLTPGTENIVMNLNALPRVQTYRVPDEDLKSKFTTNKGQFPVKGGTINYRNQIFINEDGSYDPVGKDIDLIQRFYNTEIGTLSETSGFSPEFLLKRRFNSVNSFNNYIVELVPEQEVMSAESQANPLPNFRGKEFIERLAHKLRTPVHFLTTTQLNGLGQNFGTKNGLIYKGEVYINTDNFNDNVVMHELAHIILTYFKENSYDGYLQLLNSIEYKGLEYDELSKLYPELTNQDLKEEYFAEKFANSFTSLFSDPALDNMLSQLEFKEALNRLFDLTQTLDSDVRDAMSMTIKELATRSEANLQAFGSIFGNKAPFAWRQISNIKSKLLTNSDKDNNLVELNCR